VIDTNVAIVANARTPHAGPDCVIACVEALSSAIEHRIVLIDDMMRILDEYRRRLSLSGQPGPGDRFVKWLWLNQANDEHCRAVTILPRGLVGDFAEFPSDRALASFDLDDRKFVAVAVSSGLAPPILNASDTDWWDHRVALERNGIRVEFLCPALMTRGR
jgi:hypothetical protein